MHTEPTVINIAPARGWQEGDAAAADDTTVFVTIKPARMVQTANPDKAGLRAGERQFARDAD